MLASSMQLEFLNYHVISCIVLVLNMIISLSYPLNFGIYCGMSEQFRDTFKKLFGDKLPKCTRWYRERQQEQFRSLDAVSILFDKRNFFALKNSS